MNEPGVVRAMAPMIDGANCCGGRRPVDRQDTQALDTCAALRAEGVTISTVAVQAPAAGMALMQGCAPSPNCIVNSTGAGSADAFAAAATHLQTQALRPIPPPRRPAWGGCREQSSPPHTCRRASAILPRSRRELLNQRSSVPG